MDALVGTLAEAELAIVREAGPAELTGMTEDELLELHKRVRRQRDKYVKRYRRQAALSIEPAGGRGKAHARNARARAKAELFEHILADVSRQLAVSAQASADALHLERLAAERLAAERLVAERRAAERLAAEDSPAGPPPPVARLKSQRTSNRPKEPALKKRRASTRAKNARRQARRDTA